MKIFLDGILVVEGKEDASYLSNYIESEIVTLGGYSLSKHIIDYLKNKRVILLTDPDDAGLAIRTKLNSLLPNVINIEIDINKCNRGNKNGVAECEINEILTKLKQHSITKTEIASDIQLSDLYDLGLLSNKELRDKVSAKLNLGKCNGKTFYKRLQSNNVKLEQLYEIIK